MSLHSPPSSWQPILSGRHFHPLSLPLSCGSGESSTGALTVRYWEEPWDFLCFWAFLTDFLVNPSTFSDAETADILMHKPPKTLARLSSGQMEGFLFCSNMRPAARLGARLLSKSVVILYYPTWSFSFRSDRVQTRHRLATQFQSLTQNPKRQIMTHDIARTTTWIINKFRFDFFTV